MTNEEAETIVKSFSRSLILAEVLRDALCPQYVPESLLEYPKDKIRQALAAALNYATLQKDKKTVAIIQSGIHNLQLFTDDETAYRENHEILGRKEYWDLLNRRN